MPGFEILKKSKISQARLTELKTLHGIISGPFFMPIATRGVVKNLTPQELKDLGAQIILGNTYHLMLRPGIEIIKKANGLHKFMNWDGPILTDSGGYQIFSLNSKNVPSSFSKTKETNLFLIKINDEGVWFQSERDGQKEFLSPEKALKIQIALSSDIMMVLDECAPYPCSYDYAKKAVERTNNWALRSKRAKKRLKSAITNQLFGIIQGSVYKDLRLQSIKEITKLNFDGYAIGGLAVGEPRKKMFEILNYTIPFLPKNKPRYLMGVGNPEEIVEAVKKGVDMFDCVIPTRNARHGLLYKFSGSKTKIEESNFYEKIHIRNEKFKKDFSVIDKKCPCYTCQNHSRAYLRYLFMLNEPLALRLATIHNLAFYLELMKKIREAIKEGFI